MHARGEIGVQEGFVLGTARRFVLWIESSSIPKDMGFSFPVPFS
jgi:hypothetical protein